MQLSDQLVQGIYQYLQTQPWQDVNPLIQQIVQESQQQPEPVPAEDAEPEEDEQE